MPEIPSHPENHNNLSSDPRSEDEIFAAALEASRPPDYGDPAGYLALLETTEEEDRALGEWREANRDELAKMTRARREAASHQALRDLRAQRAREEIEASNTDEAQDTPPEDPEAT